MLRLLDGLENDHSLQNNFFFSHRDMCVKLCIYGRCPKIVNASFLPKRPRQTVQTQITLLLMSSCLLF